VLHVVAGKDTSAWSAVVSLQLVDTVLDRDGNSLRASHMPDGKVWTRSNLQTTPSPASLDINNSSVNTCAVGGCAKFGRLYTWAMVTDVPATCDEANCPLVDSLVHQGLCPSGWHIATSGEWQALVHAAGTSTDAVGLSHLMSTTADGEWQSMSSGSTQDISGTDTYGFDLLPTQSSTDLNWAEKHLALVLPNIPKAIELHPQRHLTA
jgi:uncharacterized protein (TIGR02145 family)